MAVLHFTVSVKMLNHDYAYLRNSLVDMDLPNTKYRLFGVIISNAHAQKITLYFLSTLLRKFEPRYVSLRSNQNKPNMELV